MQNDFLNLIETRRSIRSFKSTPVSDEILDKILRAGTYAPSGMNRQSSTIIAVKSEKYRKIITKLNAEILKTDKDPYYNAPVVILVLGNPERSTFVEDGSCVLENMMLACHSLGLGSVWVHREREIFNGEEGKNLLKEWNLPLNLTGIGSIAIGYPAEIPNAKPRKENYIIKV